MSTAYASLARKIAKQNAALARQEAKKASAPPSALAIPTRGLEFDGTQNVVIRQVGATRRVFLRQPYLSPVELEGLAYRIRVLSKNEALNSVLIATNNNEDNPHVLPVQCCDAERPYEDIVDIKGVAHRDDYIWHVAGGYDPLEIYKSGLYRDRTGIQSLLNSVQDLALACRGDSQKTKIPIITMPHGLVNDGGYALCMGSYVLATRDSSFRIMNPSRGLALDPIGLSWILPRVGWEFQQPSAQYSHGIAKLLALTGIEANSSDLMETGLATHYMDGPNNMLGTLEQTLAQLAPWNQQTLVKKPIRLMGEPESKVDVNADFRNVVVANTLYAFTSYNAEGSDLLAMDRGPKWEQEDPSLVLDPTPYIEERESDIVNYAATFDNILQQESTVIGILERFREVAASFAPNNDPEEQEGIDVAADLVERMERQCPLSLCVVNRLLQLGQDVNQSLEDCMEREKRVQTKLFGMQDYQNWAKHALSHQSNEKTNVEELPPPFTGWKHKSVEDVTNDEVEELLLGE